MFGEAGLYNAFVKCLFGSNVQVHALLATLNKTTAALCVALSICVFVANIHHIIHHTVLKQQCKIDIHVVLKKSAHF